VRFLYHVNVIGAISDGKRDFVLVFFNEPDYFAFLLRAHPATNNRVAFRKNIFDIVSC
jgi:hypothetical protein